MWKILLFLFMVVHRFAGFSNLCWHLLSLRVYSTSLHALFSFRVSIEKSCVILRDLPLYVIYSFSFAAFNTLLLFCLFNFLVILWQGDFLFWLNPFGVLYCSWTFIVISSTRLEKLPFMILLKMYSGILSWYSPCSIPIIQRFYLLTVSHIPWMFVSEKFKIYNF